MPGLRRLHPGVPEGRDPAQVITAYGAAGLLYYLMLPTWIVGSLWLSRARENAVLIAPDQIRRSAVWAWLGWWAPIVFLWFPKQIVDDSWQITSSAAAVGQRVRDLDEDADGVVDRQFPGTRQPVAKRLAVHERHGVPEKLRRIVVRG